MHHSNNITLRPKSYRKQAGMPWGQVASFLTPVKHASVAALKKCNLGKENGKCFQNNRAHTSSLSQKIWRWNKSENSHDFLSLRLLFLLLHWTAFPFFFSFFCSFLLRFPGWGGEKRWGRREDSWWRKSGENSPVILCQTDFSFEADRFQRCKALIFILEVSLGL